ncbi:MAG TPA: TauD/TfdA family dioxygenase [Vicinamibacterales bacterium]|nr:TauD/TfdA family dioxygenase [Vicinamibacterales bacterium]
MSDETSVDPSAWRAGDMRGRRDWTVELTPAHQAEILAAVARTRQAGKPIHEITRAGFVLPTLAPILDRVRDDVVDGRGFALIRGVPIDQLDREGVMRAWFGTGAYLGVARSQNRAGHLIGHVYDLGEDKADPKTRLYRTNARQRFHIDSCDVVGLLCLRPARSGGASAIASSTAIADEIRRTRPDLAAVLAAPFVYDRKGEIPAGKGPHYLIPIVHHHDGLTTVFFARDFIESAQKRFDDIPRLTPEQIEALDLVERLAESDQFRLDMDFRPGDVQFVHNHVILHSRSAYDDWDDPARKRHLLRLWLSAHGARPLPPVFEERYGPLVEGQPRGGILVRGVTPAVPLVPE